ncbi:MAG: hypothetical protein ACT4NY_21800 [Pseudonocardiales bacterium]
MGVFPGQEVTTARVNGRAVVVRQAHRRWVGAGSVPGPGGCVVYEPVLVTVSVPVRLSLEDADDQQCTFLVIHERAGTWAIYPHGVGKLGVRLAQAEAVRVAETILAGAR